MIERYEGDAGQRRLIAALMEDRLVAHQADLAERLAAVGQLVAFAPGDVFISQGDHTNDVFFIVAGAVSIAVNGVIIANRFPGQSVGEMAAVEPSQPRSATVTATEPTVVLKVTEEQFSGVAEAFPTIWRRVAATLSRRLNERNHLVTAKREVIKVFVMSSREALPIVDLMIEQFAHDPFLAVAWKNGVFKASHYTLDDLEAMLDDSDFAVALAYQDDVVITRDDEWPVMRDNVVFELGLFMGRLGRRRAFLMEPRDVKLKLASDLTGLTTIPYRYVPGKNAADYLAPACAALRRLILDSMAKE